MIKYWQKNKQNKQNKNNQLFYHKLVVNVNVGINKFLQLMSILKTFQAVAFCVINVRKLSFSKFRSNQLKVQQTIKLNANKQ